MTFSENFQTGRLRAEQPGQPQRQTLPVRQPSPTTPAQALADSQRITGQVSPGQPIPQPPVPPPMTADQGLQMMAESIAVMAAQLTRVTNALESMEKRQAKVLQVLEDSQDILELIEPNVRGFTDDGASFRSSASDPFTTAYTSIVAPMIAIRCRNNIDDKPLADIVKAGVKLARDMVEEMAAYREQGPATASLAQAMSATAGDPWGELGR